MTYIFIFTFTTSTIAVVIIAVATVGIRATYLILLLTINKLGIIFPVNSLRSFRFNHIGTTRFREHFFFRLQGIKWKKKLGIMATTENVNKRNALLCIGL